VELRELSPSYRLGNLAGFAKWMEIYNTSLAVRLAALPLETRTQMRRLAMQGGPAIETVAAARVPMHLIYGDADLYAPPALARMLAQKLPGVGVTNIPEAGHSANWEMPRSFNAALLSFLSEKAKH
jgi:pimeloyl-ACP methyl ester carboxylesterase